MIIPALVRHYDRMLAMGDDELAPPGYSRQQIGFRVVLEKDGTLFEIQPLTDGSESQPAKGTKGAKAKAPSKPRPQRLLVPGQSKPPGAGINPCLLWDNPTYMLGLVPEGREPEWALTRFEAFRNRHLALRAQIKDRSFDAVCEFLEHWKPAKAEKHRAALTNFGVFQIRGEGVYVHDRPKVEAWWKSQMEAGTTGGDDAHESTGPSGGRPVSHARLHEPKIKGIIGAQSVGATLVSFNQDAFNSYGKEQGSNAPVTEESAFKYCTALNRLLSNDARRIRLGGDTFVFWGEGTPAAEEHVFSFFSRPLSGDESAERARQAYERAAQGKADEDLGPPSSPFYILGLAPNAARISVRLWHQSTVGAVTKCLESFVEDLAIEPVPNHAPRLTVFPLIAETAPPASRPGYPDVDRITPGLAAEFTLAVLTGRPFPSALLARLLTRCRVEGLADESTRIDWHLSQFRRCSLIRACILRVDRARGFTQEVPVSLNEDHPSVAYQLGRLFAVLERTQQSALGRQINVTIKDRYFGAAMTTPAAVFPRLLRLSQHHIKAIDTPGLRGYWEKLVGQVMTHIAEFPSTLGLREQGLFSIGYYHQRHSVQPKRDDAVDAGSTVEAGASS